MRRLASVGLILSLVVPAPVTLVSSGCTTSEVARGVALADRVLKAIGAYKAALDAIESLIRKAKSTLAAVEKSGRTSPEDLATNFDHDWQDAHKQYVVLKDRFDEMQDAARERFAYLDKVAKTISNPSLKSEQLKINGQAQRAWADTAALARNEIRRLASLLQQGDDFSKVLALEAMRREASRQLAEMEGLATEAGVAVTNLQQLLLGAEAAMAIEGQR